MVGKTQQEIQSILEADMQKFSVEVSELADEEATIAKEEEIMVLMNENDEFMKAIEYDVADSCEFDGQHFNKETVGRMIADFISSQEVEWSYTLGLYELAKLWKNKDLEKIQYHAYDSTLRILGGIKYKGVESWKKILTINAFLGSCHEAYVRDTTYMVYLSNLHNIVIDALKKFNPELESEANAVEAIRD